MRRTDFDEHIVNERCPHCNGELIAYLFRGTWIYVCNDCNFIGFEYRNESDFKNFIIFERMRSTSIDNVKNFLLKDDDTDFGGTSFSGETVEDFIEDKEYNSIWDLNKDLVDCGIKPIDSFGFKWLW